MQLPFMSFANIISEQTFFFLYRYDRVLTYDICSTMIVFYYQTKILINFFYVSGIRISNFEFLIRRQEILLVELIETYN